MDRRDERGGWALVIVHGDGRAPTHVRLSSSILATLLAVLLLMPTGFGLVLGARQHGGVRPALLALGAHLGVPTASARLVPYLLLPESKLPPKPAALPPPVPEVVLPTEPATPEARRGHFRVYALHLHEGIDVVPFDEEGRPIAEAFAEIRRLWRCRITGHEVDVHPRLVRLITALNDLYDRPVHLISGHRVPGTIDTSPTSQHVVGTAGDLRVPGVPPEELRALAKRLGGRGVGLYPENRFVHVDFRPGRRYFWTQEDQSEGDEQGDVQLARSSSGSDGQQRHLAASSKAEPASSADKSLAETAPASPEVVASVGGRGSSG